MINLEQISYHLTSRETKPNKEMKEKVLPFFLENNVRTVLDYGCGKFLRDSLYLSEKGFVVDALDLPEQIERIDINLVKKIHFLSSELKEKKYDAVLLNFVLQVLPTKKQREEVLEDAILAVKKEGYIVLSLRNQSEINRHLIDGAVRYKDGLIMGDKNFKTFVKGYTKDEVKKIISDHDLKLIEFLRTYSSFISISKKLN